MVDLTPLRPASLHEEVAARLRTMVFERQLAPGQWIDEMALAGDWQISRTPLREALKVLAAEGLVTLVPRQGCRVTELSVVCEELAVAGCPLLMLIVSGGICTSVLVRHGTEAQKRANELSSQLDSEKRIAARTLAQVEVLNQQIASLTVEP